MKKILFLLSFALLTLHGAKPVGLWQGNSWQRVGELLKAQRKISEEQLYLQRQIRFNEINKNFRK